MASRPAPPPRLRLLSPLLPPLCPPRRRRGRTRILSALPSPSPSPSPPSRSQQRVSTAAPAPAPPSSSSSRSATRRSPRRSRASPPPARASARRVPSTTGSARSTPSPASRPSSGALCVRRCTPWPVWSGSGAGREGRATSRPAGSRSCSRRGRPRLQPPARPTHTRTHGEGNRLKIQPAMSGGLALYSPSHPVQVGGEEPPRSQN